jgi:hypothetical protein
VRAASRSAYSASVASFCSPTSSPSPHRSLAPDQRPAACRHLRLAPALGTRRPEPARQRPLADSEAPRDLGLAALAGLVGGEHALSKVGGAGARHRSFSDVVNPA